MTAVTTAGSMALGADRHRRSRAASTQAVIRWARADPNPRFFLESLVKPSRWSWGRPPRTWTTGSPVSPGPRADAYALASQRKAAAAYAAGQISPTWSRSPSATAELGWGLATKDEPPRPDTTLSACPG